MKFITHLKRSALVQLGALALIVVGSVSAHAQNIPVEGIYTGFIQVPTGPAVAMSLKLYYSDIDIPSDPGDVLPFKKQIIGAFTIENEAGPFQMSYVNYNIEQGYFDLYYVRSSSGSSAGGSSGGTGSANGTGASGSAGASAPTSYGLHFRSHYDQTTIKGTAESGLGRTLGPFSLKLDPKQTGLVVRSQAAIGNYQGYLDFGGQDKDKLSIYISASAGMQINPSYFELDTTPGRIGSLLLNDLLIIPFSQIYIDYFTHTVQMNYSNPTTQASVAYSGAYDGNSLTGTGVSAFNGRPGSFTVNRVVPPTKTSSASGVQP